STATTAGEAFLATASKRSLTCSRSLAAAVGRAAGTDSEGAAEAPSRGDRFTTTPPRKAQIPTKTICKNVAWLAFPERETGLFRREPPTSAECRARQKLAAKPKCRCAHRGNSNPAPGVP